MRSISRFAFLLCLALGALPAAAFAAAPNRPNFVYIIGDDISADDLGCYGNAGARTPNIDRLAADGLRFTNAYLTASSCSPSRCSMITGRYPHNLESASELHAPLPEGVALFPKLLRDAGYYTAHAGKAHFGSTDDGGSHTPTGPAKAAFDVGGSAGRGDSAVKESDTGGEKLWVARLRGRPAEKPFFMWFASNDAHRGWNAGSFTGMTRPADVMVPPFLADTPETRKDLALYYDEVMRLDYYVGEVVEELKRQKVFDNTVILILADNGRPFPRSKTHLYDDGIKAPLVVHWPATVKQAADVPGFVSAIDLAPTILELAGISKPPTVQGVSFAAMLRDPSATVRDYVFAEKNWHNFTAHIRMVRAGPFVYMRNAWPELPQPGASDTFYNPSADALKKLHVEGRLNAAQAGLFQLPRPREEFYDLRADPHQLTNLAGKPQSAAEMGKLRALLDRWTKETGDTVQSRPTPSNIDYATGKKVKADKRGIPAGAEAGALKINAPGPVRAR
jgi:N-sulfoglucosamine sulfohydrolase